MLSQHTPVATLPTRDLSRARMFYEDTLGFAPERESVAGVAYKSGDAMVFLYQSEYAGTNKATAVSSTFRCRRSMTRLPRCVRRASHS